ncbi:MAG: hypothetical protein ABL958_05880, partial [Bdellovibrionia bacterium]
AEVAAVDRGQPGNSLRSEIRPRPNRMALENNLFGRLKFAKLRVTKITDNKIVPRISPSFRPVEF